MSIMINFNKACSEAFQQGKGIDYDERTKSFLVVNKAKENLERVSTALLSRKEYITHELSILPPSSEAYDMIKFLESRLSSHEGESLYSIIGNRAQIVAMSQNQRDLIKRTQAAMQLVEEGSFEVIGGNPSETSTTVFDEEYLSELKGLVVELKAAAEDVKEKKVGKNPLLLKCIVQAAEHLYSPEV